MVIKQVPWPSFPQHIVNFAEVAQNFLATCFHVTRYVLILTIKRLRYILDDLFKKNSSGHPDRRLM
jgi:hypothetical protein